MRDLNELMRSWIQKEILTPQEVAKILGVSRQQVSNLVAQGKLLPAKSVPGCNLFLLEDIETYKFEKTRAQMLLPKKILGSGVTRKCNEFVKNELKDLDRIIAIYIYFDDYDAMLDGFYTTDKIAKRDTLMSIKAPTFVLKYDDLDEVWLRGYNCGYGGAGPTGSEEFLRLIEVPKDIARLVYSSNTIKYYKEGNSWEFTAESRFDNNGVVKPLRSFNRPQYIYNNNFVITQDNCGIFWRDRDPLSFLKKNEGFIPNPTQITIYNNAKAFETGHYILSNVEEQYYKVIIKDQSGREIWLDCPFDEKKSISRQVQLKNLFEYLDVDYPTNDNILGTAKKLLGLNLSVQTFGVGK